MPNFNQWSLTPRSLLQRFRTRKQPRPRNARRSDRAFVGCTPLEGRTFLSTLARLPEVEVISEVSTQSKRLEVLRTKDNQASTQRRPSRTAQRPARFAAPIVLRDIVYRFEGDRPERLDVYIPNGPVPAGGRPVLLAIHGGGWRQFSKEHYGPRVAAPLLRSGFIVVAPNYSLSGAGRPTWPENFEDVREAVRWVRRSAEILGADSDRIVAMGESSGGHLAALLGTYPDGPVFRDGLPAPGNSIAQGVSARVAGVVNFSGPAELISLLSNSDGGPAAVQMLGGRPEQLFGRYLAASPTSHVSSDDPPMLLVHGTNDPVVAFDQSQILSAVLSAHGVAHRLVTLPGGGHGFGPFGGRVGREVNSFLSMFA